MSEGSLMLEECQTSLTEKDLDRVELQLGYRLPAPVRAHYLRFNGGYLPEEQMERQRIAFGGFNPIRYGTLPAEQLYRDLLESFPELAGWFPFAYDQGGNCFLIDLDEKRSLGSIRVWLMDGEELAEVTDSFDEFITILSQV
ncbi:SMI1/KNR4 family protein [Saccharibacillus sacchari]|uniref:SMI1/KNR4 family protein n=1 Tax=Saccharibacillus sacchari TaxID=456493 RepID=A0ACC6PBE3_9BACL